MAKRSVLAVFLLLIAAVAAFLILKQPPRLSGKRRVIFVGLDGADWQYLDGLMARGLMPNLARLVAEGQGGALVTIHPPLSPLVWTTMMTGVSPIDHRILDFARFNPATGAPEPITSDERRVPAIWNIVSRRGERATVIGLWATYPAEQINGLIVSDRFISATRSSSASGAVFPPDSESWARRIADDAKGSADFAAVREYLPWLTEAEYNRMAAAGKPYAHPVSAVRQLLIELRETTDLAAGSLARDNPALTVAYYEGTDAVGHVFAPFAPPRQQGISQEDFDRYSRVPEIYFQAVDRVLGGYRARAQKTGAVLMLASDHGFMWQEGRPVELSSIDTATAAKWHRDEGIYLLWGKGIAPNPGHPRRGSVRQVCATLLALMGMPEGKGQYGPPLPGAPVPVTPALDYASGYTRAAAKTDSGPGGADEMEKLKALGYIGGDTHAPRHLTGPDATRTASSFNNEGLLYREQKEMDKAKGSFERALQLDSNYISATWNLSDLLYAEGRDLDRSDGLLLRAVSLGMPEGNKKLAGRCLDYQKAGAGDRAMNLLSKAIEMTPGDPELRLMRGSNYLEQKQCREAADDFQAAVRLAPGNALAHASLGVATLCLGDAAAAARAFQKSLELDPNQPEIRSYLQQISH